MSYAEFVAALKLGPSARVQKLAPPSVAGGFYIPDWKDLQEADVVLASPRNFELSPVYLGQLAMGFAPEDAKWTHAMLYTGDLHIAEAQTFFTIKGSGWPRSGTRSWPLSDYLKGSNLQICRLRSGEASRPLRRKVAARANADIAAANRGYDFRRIVLESWAYSRVIPMLPKKWLVSDNPPTGAAQICSEFVLECMAEEGVMVDEYLRVRKKELFFCPASFITSSRFEVRNLSTRHVLAEPDIPPRANR